MLVGNYEYRTGYKFTNYSIQLPKIMTYWCFVVAKIKDNI